MFKQHHEANDNYYKSKVYVGTRYLGAVCGDVFTGSDTAFWLREGTGIPFLSLFWVIDFAVCLVVDTLLLPLTATGVIGTPGESRRTQRLR